MTTTSINEWWRDIVYYKDRRDNLLNPKSILYKLQKFSDDLKIYLEAASRSFLIVSSGLPPQESNSCLPPHKNAAKHSVAFWVSKSIIIAIKISWHSYMIKLLHAEDTVHWKRRPASLHGHHFQEQPGWQHQSNHQRLLWQHQQEHSVR